MESKTLSILISCSGGGKSTLAELLKKENPNTKICSADYYFMRNGVYEFKPECLRQAHEKCQSDVSSAMLGTLPVIVDNTNLSFADFSLYLRFAGIWAYKVIFHIFDCKPEQIELLIRRNVHHVPEKVILKQFQKLGYLKKHLKANMKSQFPTLKYEVKIHEIKES